jgi:hypothetical protein
MNFKYTPYRIVPLSRLILFKLYINHINSEKKNRFSVEEICSLFSIPISPNLAKSALNLLRGETYNARSHYITRHSSEKAGGHLYQITNDGILLVERALRNKQSDISYFMRQGDSAIDEIAGLDSIFMTADEALESDPWIPLRIDRDDPVFVETLAEVEAALDVIRGDNGYAANEPDERQGILGTLETGLDWLKNRTPTFAQIRSWLIVPLEWLATKFAGAIIGEAAKKAAQKLVDYLSQLV